MSLREKFRDELLDAQGKPRLAYARSYFFDYGLELDFDELQQFYCDWRDFDEYVVLQRQMESLRIQGEIEKETIALKCAKRGNDVYWWHMWKRLKFLYKLKNHTFFDVHGTVRCSSVLFVTLTYDTRRSSIQEAWETIGDDFNKWIRNLRKNFGRISYLRCWEASKKGYPHIHVLMIFHEHQFRIAFSQHKNRRRVYRIHEKEAFEKSYHSFVDVQAVIKIREGVRYITKYLSKTKYAVQSQTLTLALCWLFKKRSFAVSGDFQEAVYAIINVQYRIIQTDLFCNKIDLKVVWVFIGVFSASKLGIDRNEWRKVIVDREILTEILS